LRGFDRARFDSPAHVVWTGYVNRSAADRHFSGF
jgi:hypothetical protein